MFDPNMFNSPISYYSTRQSSGKTGSMKPSHFGNFERYASGRVTVSFKYNYYIIRMT